MLRKANLSSVRVGLSLTVDQGDVDKSLSVQQSHVSSTLWGLWLFSLLDLWSLRLNLTSTSQGTVNLTLIELVTIIKKLPSLKLNYVLE